MNWLDIVIIVLILVPTVMGLKAGLIKTVLTLAGVIIGVILAGRYHGLLAEQLTFISQPNLANIAAFVIILLVVMIIAGILASVLKWITSLMLLGWVNRLGGAALGFIMGALFCGAVLAIWARLPVAEGLLTDSLLASLLLDNFPVVLALLPGEFDSIRSIFQ
ncbi:CvpA family protein [Chloroflexota bacterium]